MLHINNATMDKAVKVHSGVLVRNWYYPVQCSATMVRLLFIISNGFAGLALVSESLQLQYPGHLLD